MPMFTINTNVQDNNIPESFLTQVSAILSDLLGKPETYICVHVNAGQKMTFAGTTEPCANCYLSCIGKIGLEENKKTTAALMEKINSDLKIPGNRMYINFTDMARQDVGWNMKTFA